MTDRQTQGNFKKLSKVGDITSDPELKQKVAAIGNAQIPDSEKIQELVAITALIKLDTNEWTKSADKTVVNFLSDEDVVAVFNTIINDPNMLAMLLDANAELVQNAKCLKDPSLCDFL